MLSRQNDLAIGRCKARRKKLAPWGAHAEARARVRIHMMDNTVCKNAIKCNVSIDSLRMPHLCELEVWSNSWASQLKDSLR